MFLRHGPPFIDRLIMHDMYNRAFEHVHDTNHGDDTSFSYYIWQLGYGLFPWTGLSAGGLLWWLRRADRSRDQAGRRRVADDGVVPRRVRHVHHHADEVPPLHLAARPGDRRADRRRRRSDARGRARPRRRQARRAISAAPTASVALFVYGVARLFPRKLMGEVISGPPPSKALGVVCIALGIVFGIVHAPALRSAKGALAKFGDGALRRVDAGGARPRVGHRRRARRSRSVQRTAFVVHEGRCGS